MEFEQGSIIPQANLDLARIGFPDVEEGGVFSFDAPITSRPGIKIGQPGGGFNLDLLNIAVNPFLSERQRDVAYLNSVFWIPVAQETTSTFTTNNNSRQTNDWYRLYVTNMHKRTLIQYDREDISATYHSIFANPGFSLTTSFDDVDAIQFGNATLGLMLGAFYEVIGDDEIDFSLDEAYQEFDNGESFKPLRTLATREQRQAINQRLNRNLLTSFQVSELEQLSGNFTFPTIITPENSHLFQIRTGLYKRRVDFFERNIGDFGEPLTFFSNLDTSQDEFGPLGFIGVLLPLSETSITRNNNESISIPGYFNFS